MKGWPGSRHRREGQLPVTLFIRSLVAAVAHVAYWGFTVGRLLRSLASLAALGRVGA
jgi:hypothetical protein